MVLDQIDHGLGGPGTTRFVALGGGQTNLGPQADHDAGGRRNRRGSRAATRRWSRALVRAQRWRRRIEIGEARSITDLAEQEGLSDAYVCRLLPLTCLAPDIEAVAAPGPPEPGIQSGQPDAAGHSCAARAGSERQAALVFLLQ